MGWRWGEANGDVWRAVLSTVWSIAVVYGLYVGWRGLGGGEQGGAFLLSDALTAELLTSTGSEGPRGPKAPCLIHHPLHTFRDFPPFKMQEEAAFPHTPCHNSKTSSQLLWCPHRQTRMHFLFWSLNWSKAISSVMYQRKSFFLGTIGLRHHYRHKTSQRMSQIHWTSSQHYLSSPYQNTFANTLPIIWIWQPSVQTTNFVEDTRMYYTLCLISTVTSVEPTQWN